MQTRDEGPEVSPPQPDATAQGFLAEARVRAARGDHAGAVESWRALLRSLPEDPGRWGILDELLESFGGLPGFSGAAEEEAALEERLQGPLEPGRRADLLRRLGWGRLQRGDALGARIPLEEAFRAAAGDRARKALTLADLGWLEFVEGRPDVARVRYEEGLDLAPDPHPARDRLASRLRPLQLRHAGPLETERAHRQALQIAAAHHDLHEQAACLFNLSLLLLDLGQVEECERLVRTWVDRLAAASPATEKPLPQQVAEAEAARLRRTLESHEWNQSGTARALGISEQAVRYKMKKYGIHRPG